MSIDQLLLNRGVLIEEVQLATLDTGDRTFALGDDDLDLLEESMARDGQLDPVIARRQGARWQVVDGFRRLAAAEHLGWARVKARLFDELSDEDAARISTRHAVTALPHPDAMEALALRLPQAAAEVVRESAQRFERRSDVAVEEAPAEEEAAAEEEPTADDAAIAAAPAMEAAPVQSTAESEGEVASVEEGAEESAGAEEEVTLEDLAARVIAQLSGISQDLSLLQENWADIGGPERTQLRDLVRYTADLLPYLEE